MLKFLVWVQHSNAKMESEMYDMFKSPISVVKMCHNFQFLWWSVIIFGNLSLLVGIVV